MIQDDEQVKDYIQRREAAKTEIMRQFAVWQKHRKQEHEALMKKAEMFLDDYFYHTGKPRTPENMQEAITACAHYLTRQQAEEEF